MRQKENLAYPGDQRSSRRVFLKKAGLAASALLLGSLKFSRAEAGPNHSVEAEISPVEDLMREHGLLNRLLLVYEEGIRRLQNAQDFSPGVLSDAAGIIQQFIENYHEKLEEDYLFPRFEKAGKLTALVQVLRDQHRAGSALTRQLQSLCTLPQIRDADSRNALIGCLTQFVRMYRPHEAREDTVLFPALRGIVSAHEYDALGEEFEDREHRLFGRDGFENIRGKVESLEKQLGIEDLAQFTAKPVSP